MNEAGSATPGGAGGGQALLYLDPANYAVSGQSAVMRLSVVVTTNATAPACNFTVGLYPVTASAGAAAAVSVTAGTVVAGSSAVVTAPAATARTLVETADFAAPAAGGYVVMLTLSTDMAANSSAVVRATLKARAL